jgi:Rieske Fe-S protein
MYDREGRVMRGPAERALRQFPTSLEAGDELVIRTGGT